MSKQHSWLAIGAMVCASTLPTLSWARSDVDTRLERLENIVENQVNINLLNQLDVMQQEVQELRGKLEEQQNALQALNQKQERLYLNLDSRLSAVAPKPAVQEQANLMPAIDPPATRPIPVDPPTPVSEQGEKASYDAAYKLLNSKKYQEAINSFNSLLQAHPKGTYVANAHYWLGEIYMSQWQANRSDATLIQQAIKEFNTVTTAHPQHHKAVDALLKLGLVEMEQEHWDAAKELLSQVVKKYPSSARARLAETKLQKIKNITKKTDKSTTE